MKRLADPLSAKNLAVAFFCILLTGCQTIPPKLLTLPTDYLAARELQMRKYETADDKKVIQASASVLQDLGFTIDKSETDVGLIVSSKERTAVNAGQVAVAVTLDLLAAMGGSYSNTYARTDKEQKIQASVVVNPSLVKNSTVVRVKFQRIVWNQQGQVSRFETLKDATLYQGFFEKLSKSIFLEDQKI